MQVSLILHCQLRKGGRAETEVERLLQTPEEQRTRAGRQQGRPHAGCFRAGVRRFADGPLGVNDKRVGRVLPLTANKDVMETDLEARESQSGRQPDMSRVQRKTEGRPRSQA